MEMTKEEIHQIEQYEEAINNYLTIELSPEEPPIVLSPDQLSLFEM